MRRASTGTRPFPAGRRAGGKVSAPRAQGTVARHSDVNSMDATSNTLSATHQDPAPSGDGASARVGPGRVVTVALALLLLLATVAMLTGGQVRPIDGRERIERTFEVRALPFDLPVALALALPGGEEIVQLGDPDQLDADAARRAASGAESSGGPPPGAFGEDQPPDPVWRTLGEGAPADPLEATFVWYPSGRARSVLARQFGSLSFGDIGQLGEQGGEVLVESGEVEWHGYGVPFRRTREFRRIDGEPGFEDRVRVNLTRGREACVLFLRWRRGAAGSGDAVREALAGLAPRGE